MIIKYNDNLKGSPGEAMVRECVSEESMIIITIRRTSTNTVSRPSMSLRLIVSLSTGSKSSDALGACTTTRN